jgi:Flp pilus assembly protein CpaB
MRRIHASQLPDGVVSQRDEAVGRVVAAPVLRGSFVTARNLAPRTRTGLDGIVPDGMRAIRVTVSGALRPRAGAAVDVLASFDTRNAEAGGDGPATVVVAAGVLVLGTDTRASGGTGRADALGVTLLVDRADAARLADAQVNGVLTLALVPPEDAASIPLPGRHRS